MCTIAGGRCRFTFSVLKKVPSRLKSAGFYRTNRRTKDGFINLLQLLIAMEFFRHVGPRITYTCIGKMNSTLVIQSYLVCNYHPPFQGVYLTNCPSFKLSPVLTICAHNHHLSKNPSLLNPCSPRTGHTLWTSGGVSSSPAITANTPVSQLLRR